MHLYMYLQEYFKIGKCNMWEMIFLNIPFLKKKKKYTRFTIILYTVKYVAKQKRLYKW